MSTKIEYKCDFCLEGITSDATKDGTQGWVRSENGSHEWSAHLRLNLVGPHICQKCLLELYNVWESQ